MSVYEILLTFYILRTTVNNFSEGVKYLSNVND